MVNWFWAAVDERVLATAPLIGVQSFQHALAEDAGRLRRCRLQGVTVFPPV